MYTLWNVYCFVASTVFLILFRLDVDEYYIDQLTVDHADYIADYWTDNKDKDASIIKKYLEHNYYF